MTTRVYKTSEAQRKATKKYEDSRREQIRARMKQYYRENSAELRRKRRARYLAKKNSN